MRLNVEDRFDVPEKSNEVFLAIRKRKLMKKLTENFGLNNFVMTGRNLFLYDYFFRKIEAKFNNQQCVL